MEGLKILIGVNLTGDGSALAIRNRLVQVSNKPINSATITRIIGAFFAELQWGL
jgi:hypothetical protein